MAALEEGAGELSASVLAVHVVVSIDKVTTGDAVAHLNAIIDRIHQTVGQVVGGLNSAGEVRERDCEAVDHGRGVGGRRLGALQALGPKKPKNPAELFVQNGDTRGDGAGTVVPAWDVIGQPWSDGRTIVIVGGESLCGGLRGACGERRSRGAGNDD